MLPRYYARDGRLIEREEWYRLQTDPNYCRVQRTELPGGRIISTMWLGLDHSWARHDPIQIFETIVSDGHEWRTGAGWNPDGYGSALEVVRYATEAEAIAGHIALVDKWAALQ